MGFFSGFFGDSDLENVDARIDNLINVLPGHNKSVPVDNISGDFINAFIQEAPKGEIDRLLETVSVSRQRLERYNVYDEAYRYVPVIKRILTVYISNILQKNPVTGKCLLVKDSENLTGENKTDKTTSDAAKKLAEECIKAYDLIIKLRKKILPNELVYGDCYVEIVDLTSEGKKKIDTNTSFSNIQSTMPLFEAEMANMSRTVEQMKLGKDHNGKITKEAEIDRLLSKISEYFVEVQDISNENLPPSDPSKNYVNSDSDDLVTNYDDILMKIHKPHRVIALETDFGTLLGYLVVVKDEVPQTLNLTQSLSTLVGRITTLNTPGQDSQNTIVDKLVRYILRTILLKSQGSGKLDKATNIDELLTGLPPDIYHYLKRLFVEQGLSQKNTHYNKLKVRFVPASDMIAFTIPSSEYDPYGQSFIDTLVFPCKLYILSQLSNVIIKLSRAAPVRKWSIDIGQTQMQAGQIQKLKRELYNTRITLDDLSSFKSIPKILSDYLVVTF